MVRHEANKEHPPQGDSTLLWNTSECSNVLKGNVCDCDPYWWATEGACITCKTITKLRCNGCYVKPFFCSKECQSKGWESGHKSVCGFWKEIKVEGKTFYEVKKKIPAGTKLFRKAPLFVQPDKIQLWQYNACPAPLEYVPRNIKLNPLVTCLSCAGFCAPIEPVTPTDQRYRRCPICRWPVCNTAKCAEKHKERPECSILSRCGLTWEETIATMEPFALIGLIRALSLKKNKPFKWEQLMKLETFTKEMPPADNQVIKRLFEFLKQSLKIDWLTASEWNKFLFIQNQNRFRCNHRYAWDTRFATIVYEGPRGTILPHGCRPNTYIKVDKLNFIGTVVAHFTILKGDVLTANLDPEFPRTMKPLYARNSFLTATGYPHCGQSGIDCEWCLNPQTEGGTMLSGIKCKKCPSGHLMPKAVVGNMWEYSCSSEGCDNVSNHVDVQQEESQLYRDYSTLNGDFPKVKKWIAETEKNTLHPLNYLCLVARFYLAGKSSSCIMRSRINSLEHLRKAKDEYLPYFKFMLRWMDEFTPGRHYYKADFLFFDTLLTLGCYAIDLNEKTKTLQEVEKLVGESLKNLEWCWEIYNEDPMRNLMDINSHQNTQDKIVRQFFVEAENMHRGLFKPLNKVDKDVVEGAVSESTDSESSCAKADEGSCESGDENQEDEFKNLRRLSEMKVTKLWTGFSHLGDHLAPPDDAAHLEARIYSIIEGAEDLNFLD